MKVILVLFSLLFLVSCSSVLAPDSWQPESTGIFWPVSSETSRVEHLLSVVPGRNFPVRANVGLWSWFAGKTSVDPLVMPYGITYQDDGIIWVASPTRQIICKINLRLDSLEYFQQMDGQPFVNPADIFWDKRTGDLYVSDVGLRRVLHFNDKLSFLGYLSPPDGFGRPAGVSVSASGDVYVVDVALNRVAKFSQSAEFVGFVGADAQLLGPTNIAIGGSGRIYVADSLRFRVAVFDSNGKYLFDIGSLGDSPGSFARPRGIAVDSQENIYISDAAFDNIQIFNAGGDLLMFWGGLGSNAGSFSQPAGLSIDMNDRLYVADSFNNRVEVFQLYPQGH